MFTRLADNTFGNRIVFLTHIYFNFTVFNLPYHDFVGLTVYEEQVWRYEGLRVEVSDTTLLEKQQTFNSRPTFLWECEKGRV